MLWFGKSMNCLETEAPLPNTPKPPSILIPAQLVAKLELAAPTTFHPSASGTTALSTHDDEINLWFAHELRS